MAIAVTVVAATDASRPNAVTVTGLTAGQQVVFMRSYAGTVERVAGVFTADGTGTISQPDYLYPFDTPIIYLVYDTTATTLLGQSTATPAVPSQGIPWIRDVVFPALRYSSVRIIDVTDRTRAARVNQYGVVAQPYAITTGDVRSGSTGTLSLYCVSHADRDAVLYAISTGNPCLMRIPKACQVIVDEMTFTPLDVQETRVGVAGACVLTVDFVEVQLSEVGTFRPVSYAVQKANAAAAGLKYGSLLPAPSGLALNFVGKTYRDMYLSPTGIKP
jgi:hypothetical protein